MEYCPEDKPFAMKGGCCRNYQNKDQQSPVACNGQEIRETDPIECCYADLSIPKPKCLSKERKCRSFPDTDCKSVRFSHSEISIGFIVLSVATFCPADPSRNRLDVSESPTLSYSYKQYGYLAGCRTFSLPLRPMKFEKAGSFKTLLDFIYNSMSCKKEDH